MRLPRQLRRHGVVAHRAQFLTIRLFEKHLVAGAQHEGVFGLGTERTKSGLPDMAPAGRRADGKKNQLTNRDGQGDPRQDENGQQPSSAVPPRARPSHGIAARRAPSRAHPAM